MTECERLIANGTFTRDFFKPEVRCDFLVDEKRKKNWAIGIDLLLQFDKVCREYGLKYWLIAGTLLGAIRHKGFIPWDDDIDLIMPRPDYDKILRLSKAFPYPYFLQTQDTDRDCYYSFAKIRNSLTTGASAMFSFAKMNHGMFLDVYPLDDTDMTHGPDVFARIDKLNRELSTYMRKDNPNLDDAGRNRVASYCGRNPAEIYREVQRLPLEAGADGVHCAQFLSTLSTFSKNCFARSDFDQTELADFEGFKFPIPSGHNGVLNVLYGDYMALPPADKRIGHYGAIFNPDVPYAEFLK